MQSGKPKYKKVNGLVTSEVIDQRSVPRFHAIVAVGEITDPAVYKATWEHYARILEEKGIVVDQVKDVSRRFFGCDTEVVKKPGITLEQVLPEVIESSETIKSSETTESPEVVVTEKSTVLPTDPVVYYYDMVKNDHDTKNGSRGEMILAKAFKQKNERSWTNEMCRELVTMLCKRWGCVSKTSRLCHYFR
jgi:hypothetical protein